MNRLIEMKDVSYVYSSADQESITALSDIDLSIYEGEFVAVIGHNGSGKSTLAKLMNAILSPTTGEVLVCGNDTKDEDKLWEIRQSVGMVFQNPDNQIVATTVEEDVAFGPENLGVASENIRKVVDESLLMLDMNGFEKMAPYNLSGGQKQRVAIAGVLAMHPKCIVLDESTAMLDPIGRSEVLGAIKKLSDEGMTVVLITHFMEEAVLADRVIVIDEGKIIMQGTPKEVFASPMELKRVKLDVPQVTDLAFKLKERGLDVTDGGYPLTIEEMLQKLYKLRNTKDGDEPSKCS